MAGIAAVALGVSIPVLVLGPTGMAVAAAIAVVGLIAAGDRAHLVSEIVACVRTPLGTAVCATFAVWLISVIGSTDIARSAGVWARMIALLTAGVSLTYVLRCEPALHALALKALIVAAIVGAAFGLMTVLVWPEPLIVLRGFGTEMNETGFAAAILKSYGTAVACVMPVVLWAGWRLGQVWRAPALVFQVLAIALLVFLQSRSGLVAAALGGGVFACWFAWHHRRGWLVIAIAAVMVAAIAGAFFDNVRNNQIDAALGLPVWLVDAHRQVIWDASLQRFTEAPIFGLGLDVINELPGAGDIVPGSTVEFIPSHPHNWAIEVLGETGVVGFTAMVVTLVLLGAGGLRAARRDGAPGAALLSLCVVFFLVSLISYSFWAFWWQATFVLLASLVITPMTPGVLSAGLVTKERPS